MKFCYNSLSQMSQKWLNAVGTCNLTTEEVKYLYKILQYVEEVKLKYFQFIINHNISVTNAFLFKINKATNNKFLMLLLQRNTRNNTSSFLYLSQS